MWPLTLSLCKVPYKITRGYMVTSFLNTELSPSLFIKHFKRNMKGLEYDGFNLVIGDTNEVWHVTNRFSSSTPQLDISDDSGGTLYTTKLEKGRCYGVSNAGLDTPWPKMKAGKEIFSDIVRQMGCRGDNVYGKAPIRELEREEGAMSKAAR